MQNLNITEIVINVYSTNSIHFKEKMQNINITEIVINVYSTNSAY